MAAFSAEDLRALIEHKDAENTPDVFSAADKRDLFLKCLARYPKWTVAAQAAGVSPSSVRNWRRADPVFARDYDVALREGLSSHLEDVALERALEGYDEVTTIEGKDSHGAFSQKRVVKKVDNTLLKLLLQGNNRTYAPTVQHQHQHNHAVKELSLGELSAKIDALRKQALETAKVIDITPAPDTPPGSPHA